MLYAERIPLPSGLPAHLCVGKDGFETLCVLIGVTTREQRQSLANSPAVKQRVKAIGKAPVRQTRTAERNRQNLLAYYGEPNVRRQLWQQVRNNPPTAGIEYKPVPSLELAALSKYDATLQQFPLGGFTRLERRASCL
ncbi:MAG: hypothetical protein F4171_17700, partial [Gammaproteobacteria bacterium]|nr:hypothetical protein [Gammaproteobacteria bacterium]